MRYLYVSLLLCSAIGVSSCTSPEGCDVKTDPTLGVTDPTLVACRNRLLERIDRITQLVEALDALQEDVSKMKGKKLTGSRNGKEYLDDLLHVLMRRENDLLESVSALKQELTSHGPCSR